jgi:phage shock protein PspC (stress-responsive transcriptional regulator)
MNTRLFRSRDDRMIAGVAGGLAELWDADPSLVRIGWALLAVFTGGIALVVYIVMAIVVPEEDDPRAWGGRSTAWSAPSGTPGDATGAAPAGSAAAPFGSPAFTDSPAGSAATGPSGVPPAADWHQTRADAREMRREARAARRAARGANGRSGAVIIGVLFILVGVWYLVREYLPTVDWDWFWPLVLVGVGVLVLVLAVRPRSDDSGPGGPGRGGGA